MNQEAPTITTRTLEALGIMLEKHYGTFTDMVNNGATTEAAACNYAALWDSLITTLKHNANDSNFHELLDKQYIELALSNDSN